MSLCIKNSDVVVIAALDNLAKGMAGQAIQNMNIANFAQETYALYLVACIHCKELRDYLGAVVFKLRHFLSMQENKIVLLKAESYV